MAGQKVPFFRPHVGEDEVAEVADTLRSGWLTTGPKVKIFESAFAEAVGSAHAVALNSCTAALHLALEALEVQPGDGVLVPAHTFAATAEVVRYLGAHPILVDCCPQTTNLDLQDAERKIEDLKNGSLPATIPTATPIVGIIPVHVGGYMMDLNAIQEFAEKHGIWVVEDAAHAFPAAWRKAPNSPWRHCGDNTAKVTCFSFYANKTMTTGEGGMAVTEDPQIAERIRLMSLHGLSRDAWGRFETKGNWDYQIIAPGFKYNMTDVAAAMGIHQLKRAESMRQDRQTIAKTYLAELANLQELELPIDTADRIHSWHLFPVKLNLPRLSINRNQFFDALREHGIGLSVHWRPLHLHPYYKETTGWSASSLPTCTAVWERLISLPIFSGMTDNEVSYVIETVTQVATEHKQL
jgi:dTDP-4-amino-4,6-dideoxygalactose transaminase